MVHVVIQGVKEGWFDLISEYRFCLTTQLSDWVRVAFFRVTTLSLLT